MHVRGVPVQALPGAAARLGLASCRGEATWETSSTSCRRSDPWKRVTICVACSRCATQIRILLCKPQRQRTSVDVKIKALLPAGQATGLLPCQALGTGGDDWHLLDSLYMPCNGRAHEAKP